MIRLLFILLGFTALTAEMPCFYPAAVSLTVAPQTDSISISAEPVARGSVSVTRNGLQLVRGDDYRIDYERRLLFVLYARTLPETLLVRYEKSSLDLKPGYFHRRRTLVPESPDSAKVETPSDTGATASADNESSLFIAGSKTIGVTLGSGNSMSIDQSLNLNISGEIAKDVQVRAILTDQNMPFQPEGNTESIRELDRVLVEIETPKVKGALGDLYLSEEETRFGNFRRKIKGAQAEYHTDGYRAAGAFAVSEGLYNTMEFPGKEQQQGPYRLQGRDGSTGIIVLSGTEKVTVDGKLKKRGQNNDYVIEYGNGQITFTPNCLITGENTILVEYEYAENEYPKNLVSGSGAASLLTGRLNFSASLISETDDDQHPLRSPLSTADRADLASAGDSGAAMGSGVFSLSPDSVNVYRGFYIYSTEPFYPDSHYVYHTPAETLFFRGVAYYDVEFQFLGGGQGDYARDSVRDSTDHALSGTYASFRTIYRYRGKAGGEYLPGHALARPEAHRLGTFKYGFAPNKNITFKGEVTGSDFDRNTLSSHGDNNNLGAATENSFSATVGKYLREGGPGLFTLSARQELVQEAFAPFSPVQNTYTFLRKWNLALPSASPSVSLMEGEVDYSPAQALTVSTGGGALNLGGNATSRRGQADLLYSRRGSASFHALQEYAEASGGDTARTLWRTTGSGDLTRGTLTPRLNYQGEFKDDRAGGQLARKSNFQEYGAGLLLGRLGPLSGESEVDFRLDRVGGKSAPDVMGDSARAVTVSNRVSLSGPGTFSMDLNMVNRRNRRLEVNQWNSYRSDLINLTADARPLDGALDHRLRYNLTSTLSQTTVERYEPVPAGTGTHIRDPQSGDYVPKDGGDYIFTGTVVDRNSEGENVNSSELSYRNFFYPGKLASLKDDSGFVKDLSFDTYLLASQDKLSAAHAGWGWSFYDPYVPDLIPSHVIAGGSSRYELNFKEDVAVDAREKNLYLRLRANPRFRYNYQNTLDGFAGQDKWETYLYSLMTRIAPSTALLLEDEGVAEWILRMRDGPDPVYDILNRRLVNTLTWSLNRSFSIPFGITGGLSVNRKPELQSVPYFILKPDLVYTLPSKGKIEFSYEYIKVYTNAGLIVYEMAEGNSPGTTHRATLTAGFTLGKNMDMDFFYAWEKNENEAQPFQRGSAQLKAFF